MMSIPIPHGHIRTHYNQTFRMTQVWVMLELSDLDRSRLSVDAVCDTTDGYLRDVIRDLGLGEHTKPDA